VRSVLLFIVKILLILIVIVLLVLVVIVLFLFLLLPPNTIAWQPPEAFDPWDKNLSMADLRHKAATQQQDLRNVGVCPCVGTSMFAGFMRTHDSEDGQSE
jgi:hypothetical protein